MRPILEAGVNRIAFVDVEGAIQTIKPDGSGQRQISPNADGFFTWPTWSPDAQQLVYSGVTNSDSEDIKISLYASNASGSRDREIYVGEPGVVGLLAEGVVHYPMWSPDSKKVAFVATTSRGLTLFIDDTANDSKAQRVLDDGPLWMSWSPDSENLLVHRGVDHFIVNISKDFEVTELGIYSDVYRVPAWNPNDETITIATSENPSLSTISSADLSGNLIDSQVALRTVQPNPAFLWSPSGKFLAIASSSQEVSYQGIGMLIYRNLTIVPESSLNHPTTIRDPIFGFFWSPDSTKIAYVTTSDTRGVLRWMLVDLNEQRQRPLVDFVPSLEQLTLFQFFDQYAYSHSLWSPDSDALVFAGSLRAESVTASYSEHPGHEGFHVTVVDTDSVTSPQTIAEGFLAFWSPR